MKRRQTEVHRTIVERMREQMAMKELRAKARELGIPVEDYLKQVQEGRAQAGKRDLLDSASQNLAQRILERLKHGEGIPPPPKVAPIPSPINDLQQIVDNLLGKGQS